MACCIAYNIRPVGQSISIESTPFFARIEASNEEEARAIGKSLAEKQMPNYGNYTAYVMSESNIVSLLPWTWDMLSRLGTESHS